MGKGKGHFSNGQYMHKNVCLWLSGKPKSKLFYFILIRRLSSRKQTAPNPGEDVEKIFLYPLFGIEN
jgi:hypothetical protein